MPPKKAHDDSEPKSTHPKEKNGHGHANGKMRRVASSTGSNLKEVTNAANMPSPPTEVTATNAPASNPSVSLPMARVKNPVVPRDAIAYAERRAQQIQWTSFDRDFLHRYRREHHLTTPTAYASDYRSWVLTKPGSIGLYSPTLARKQAFRRQTKGQLANTVRKHFSSQAVQENDAVVDFVHRVRRGRLTKTSTLPRAGKKMTEPDRI
ncbi:hypothetical protein J7T55_012572 [Diaporthe amygdali]|uniref:uncharacterized protein n=1 Tax=Phomopsis amygdali TaxID=1214568 RepID=UPI0022FE8081|nr:uncharacterized protein J7T55_012572 [Diaporthe amygdali]KAJ0115296.1 hypothetical protein J7T55_012572 [Diaporthe amygdali]